jgi:serine/threonine-protein kinase
MTRGGAESTAQIGAYEVLLELAHGGMGAVFLARATGRLKGATDFERLVAVKRLHVHLSTQADSVQRFLDEAKVAARIHHANVVGIHQVGSDDAGPFLVQDYVEGDTLQGLVDHATLKRRRLPPPIVLRIALDALSGLAAVHEATDADGAPLGILHRDVSTQNLLVGRDGVTRLADFGIAKHTLRSVVTDGQYLQGRVLYMPPEYLARRPVDQRFDIYGVGITLWTALSGDAPFADASDAQLVSLAVTEGIPPLSASGLAIAPAIEAIVARACQRDPAQRFAGAREMLAAVEALGRDTGRIASHGEVAELVEELAGKELSARRAAITRARGGMRRPDGTPSGTIAPIGEARRRVGGAAVAVGAAVVVAAGIVLLVAARGSGATVTSAAPEGSTSSAPPISVTIVSAPPSATPAAAVTGNAASAAASSTAQAGVQRRGAQPSKAPTSAPVQAPRAPAPAAPAPTTAPQPLPPPVAPAAPQGITTANPYR